VHWSASDAAVAIARDNELCALSPGSAELTATSGAARVVLKVTVEADPIGGITISPAQLDVPVGTTAQLEAVVLDIDGTRLDDRAILWRSNNPAVAKVSDSGVVEAIEQGDALVAARTGGKFATAAVKVVRGAHVAYAPAATPRPTPGRASVAVRGDTASAGTRARAGVGPVGAALPARAEAQIGNRQNTSASASSATTSGGTAGKNRMPLLAGGGIALLLLLVAIVLKPWAGGENSQTPATRNATLDVSGVVPAGGTVTARDAAGGSWQLSSQPTELAPGNYTLEFRAPGYEVADTLVALAEGDSVAWALDPRAMAVAPTSNDPQIQVGTPIPDGTVALAAALPAGGFAVARDRSGRTWPLSSRPTALAPGTYTLEFSAPGYLPADSTMELRPGQASLWSPIMREAARPAEPPSEATLEVRGSVPRGATLIARDASGRAWPLVGGRSALPPGSYTLEFSAAGYDTDTQSVTLRAGQTEVCSPAMRAVNRPPPVVVDVRADQAAIAALVQEFRATFDRRDTAVVRLLPAANRPTWSALFVNRGVTDFSATLGAVEPARVTGDSATVQFTLNVSFRSGNQTPNQVLRYVGTARRTPSGWQLFSLENQR
jgi:hypothetical protein